MFDKTYLSLSLQMGIIIFHYLVHVQTDFIYFIMQPHKFKFQFPADAAMLQISENKKKGSPVTPVNPSKLKIPWFQDQYQMYL